MKGKNLQGGRNENYKLKENYSNDTFSALAKALAWFNRNISIKTTKWRAYKLLARRRVRAYTDVFPRGGNSSYHQLTEFRQFSVVTYSEKITIWLSTGTASGNLCHLAYTSNVRSDSKYVNMDSHVLQSVGVEFGQVLIDIWLPVSNK